MDGSQVQSLACPMSFPGFMIVNVTGFIRLLPLVIALTMFMWESSQ